MRTWGQIPLGQFLVAELNVQYPVKSFAPYLGGRGGRVPSDSLRKFLQEVNLYNSFKHFRIKSMQRIAAPIYVDAAGSLAWRSNNVH